MEMIGGPKSHLAILWVRFCARIKIYVVSFFTTNNKCYRLHGQVTIVGVHVVLLTVCLHHSLQCQKESQQQLERNSQK
jgi:hypothetical protein